MATPDPEIKFDIDAPLKGVWTHASPASCPAQTWPNLINVDIPAGVVTTMAGNEVFLDNDYPAGTINLLCDRRVAGAATEYLVSKINATDERVYTWNVGAADWYGLRIFQGTAARWWSWVQYGTDIYMSNPTDGIHYYDGTTLIPVGAKSIATMEATEAALWTGSGAAATNQYCEGRQSYSLTDAGAPVTATFHPAATVNLTTGRYQARSYLLSKTGTDYYHFKIRFDSSETNHLDTTNTKAVFTDTAGDTLTFPMTTWLTSRGGSVLDAHPTLDTWYDIYLLASSGTDSATYDPTLFHSFALTIDGDAAHAMAYFDDLYVIYAVTMPACQIVAEWKNMLWGLRTTANPDTHFYSPVQAPDEYDGLANFPIKGRGETITGASSFFSQLTVTCDNTTYSISGSTAGATYPAYLFDQQCVSREFGGSSHRSIIEANNRLYWWYQDMIVEYRGTGLAKISYAVDVTLDLADKTKLDYIVGAQFQSKNQIWWTWKRTAGSVNDRVLRYDYVEGAFLLTEGLATPLLLRTFSSGIERLLSVDANDADANRRVFRQDSATLKFMSGGTNTNIAYTMETPPLALPNVAMEWDYASLQYLSNTGSLVVAYRAADHLQALSAAGYTTLETIDQAAAGELGKIRIGDRSPYLQLRITSTAVPFQIQCPIVVWTRSMGDERGTA
jgi:hypothetical protein